MRRMLVFPATVAVVSVASAGSALAASGQELCIGPPATAVRTANSAGQCEAGETLIALATQSEVSALRDRIEGLQSDHARLTSEVKELKDKVAKLDETLSKVSYHREGPNRLPTLRISGANLQIVNGSDATGGRDNGLGNLIIGYDEHGDDIKQTGSHDLILGNNQTFTSYGGVIGGNHNVLAGPDSVVFGYGNVASGDASSVTGGIYSTARGSLSSVSGGSTNTASGQRSSVSGGGGNVAAAWGASVSGGSYNTAADDASSVSGGDQNFASGTGSSVSGGYHNNASGPWSSILGGPWSGVSTEAGIYPHP